VAAVNGAALFFDAPLEAPADATRTPNPALAPWYFLGLQELVHYGALLGGVVVPVALVLALIVLPYLDRRPLGIGVWFARERRVANGVFAILALTVVVLTAIGTFFRGPNWAWVWPWAP
jgi:quinol-cytochrome oxidoreductase complex cytochrome b subunit